MSFIEQLGQQAVGNTVNAVLGIATEGHEDRRQIRQQQKLTDMQLAANKDMSAYNYGQQLDMWNKTNYEAQMQHIKAAGLNPALLYGTSGGGGTTTGSGSGGGGISSGSAPVGGGEIMGMMRENNLAMQTAQIDVMKSQAELNRAEATKKSGVDTELGYQTIDALKTNITNTQANTALTKIQSTIQQIEANYKDANMDYGNEILQKQRDIISEQLKQIENQTDISTATKTDVINTVKQNAINAVLQGEVMKAGVQVDQAQIQKMSADIQQRGLEIGIKTFEAEWNANHPELGKIGGQMINSIKERLQQLMSIGKDYTAPIKITQ